MLMLAFLFAGFDDEFRSAYAKADRRRFVGDVFWRGFGDFSGDHRQRAAFERRIDGTGMGRAVEGKAIDHQRRIGLAESKVLSRRVMPMVLSAAVKIRSLTMTLPPGSAANFFLALN